MDEDDLIRTNVDFLLTETLLDNSVTADKVLNVLRHRKTTGHLTVHLAEGGIQKMVLTEKTRATQAQRDKVRKILGME